MRQVNLPAEQFQSKRIVARFEGGTIYAAEQNSKLYLIKDEGTMADFLDEVEDANLLANLVRVYKFDNKAERERKRTSL